MELIIGYIPFFFFRQTFVDVLKAAKIHICQKIKETLLQPFKSTGLAPHFWATADKSTINLRTNQCILVIAMYEGKSTVFPVGAPVVYQRRKPAKTSRSKTRKMKILTMKKTQEFLMAELQLNWLQISQTTSSLVWVCLENISHMTGKLWSWIT